jgi:hypothetical protein
MLLCGECYLNYTSFNEPIRLVSRTIWYPSGELVKLRVSIALFWKANLRNGQVKLRTS